MGKINKGFKISPNEKRKQIEEISLDVTKIYTWECPSCATVFTSTEDESKEEFINRLYEEDGVRKVELPYMIGVFCSECYTDADVQEGSL